MKRAITYLLPLAILLVLAYFGWQANRRRTSQGPGAEGWWLRVPQAGRRAIQGYHRRF